MEDNRDILKQPGSVITLVIPTTLEHLQKGFEITVHDSLGHLNQLIASPSANAFSGMTTIREIRPVAP
jgi:hypothetical protein